jgi:hypothetical protein
MSANPHRLVAAEPNRSFRAWRAELRIRRSRVIPPAGAELRLETATPEEVIGALQTANTREQAKAEINRRLSGNKANRYFFWLV